MAETAGDTVSAALIRELKTELEQELKDMQPSIVFLCPTYNEAVSHAYGLKAAQSFLATTPDGAVLVLDDASPGWKNEFGTDYAALDHARVAVTRFETWGGLTRSWNVGLEFARAMGAEFALCGNNDVIFPLGWHEGLTQALRSGYTLAGPISNAAGVTSLGKADVWRYASNYQTTDDSAALAAVSEQLRREQAGRYVETAVNGFCMLARTSDWWTGAYDAQHVFRPSNDRTSLGLVNKTPLMTCNEDELQGRWRRMGRRMCVVPSSFVFHYRSVTRGKKYAKGRWHRMKEEQS